MSKNPRKPKKRKYNYDQFVISDQQNTFLIDPITGLANNDPDPSFSIPTPGTPGPTPTPLPPPTTTPETQPGTQPGGTTPPPSTNPTPPPSGGTVTINPTEPPISSGSGAISGAAEATVITNDDSPVVEQQANDNNNQDSLEEFWEEYRFPIAVAGVAAAGAALDLSRKEDKSLLKRLFSASKSKADSVFLEYASSIRANDERMRELLRRDFARNGPLYTAWTQNQLTLSTNRDSWIAYGKPYTRANFPLKDWPGFATIKEPANIFLVNLETGQVFDETTGKAKMSTGDWVGVVADARTNTVTVTDESGRQQVLSRVKRGTFLEELENTPENVLAGVKYVDPLSGGVTGTSDLSIAAQLRTKERETLERQLAELEAGMGDLDPLERVALEEERKERQRISDEQQKAAIAEFQASEKAKKEAQEKKEKDAIEKAAQKLGLKLPDTQVDQTRYKVDLEWVKRYVDSGLAGQCETDCIESWSYDFDPDGSELVIEYTPEYRASINLPEGYKERFSRKRLIEINGMPQQYGPGLTALWERGGGVTGTLPDWAKSFGKRVNVDITTAAFAATNPLAGFGSMMSTYPPQRMFTRRSSAANTRLPLPENGTPVKIRNIRVRRKGAKGGTIREKKQYVNFANESLTRKSARMRAEGLRRKYNVHVRTVPIGSTNRYRNYIHFPRRTPNKASKSRNTKRKSR